MRYLSLLWILLFSFGCSTAGIQRRPTQAQITEINLPRSIKSNDLPFISHTGAGPYDNTLALNVPYEPIKSLRPIIEKVVGRKLDYLKSWDPHGEAHVTTVTPPEFSNILSKHITMSEIEDIALKNTIQKSDLFVLGIGSGKKEIAGNVEETFFIIVDSQRLRLIRNKIWELFVAKGGDPKAWDPTWFFPHITIGYTKQDIHEPDVYKNIRGSLDSRFVLR